MIISFGFHSLSFVSSSLAADEPAVDVPEADGSSLLLLLGGRPGRSIAITQYSESLVSRL